MEDIYKTTLMLKWANKTVRNKASKMRRARMIRKVPENNSMIIKKHKSQKAT